MCVIRIQDDQKLLNIFKFEKNIVFPIFPSERLLWWFLVSFQLDNFAQVTHDLAKIVPPYTIFATVFKDWPISNFGIFEFWLGG